MLVVALTLLIFPFWQWEKIAALPVEFRTALVVMFVVIYLGVSYMVIRRRLADRASYSTSIFPKVIAVEPTKQAQSISNSPGAVQIGRDNNAAITTNINVDRHISEHALAKAVRNRYCHIEVRSLGMGGEPYQLASQISDVVNRETGCNWGHGSNIGGNSFKGIQITYSPLGDLTEVNAIVAALEMSDLGIMRNVVSDIDPRRIIIVVDSSEAGYSSLS